MFVTIDTKYKTPFWIFGENSRKKPSQAIDTNGCYHFGFVLIWARNVTSFTFHFLLRFLVSALFLRKISKQTFSISVEFYFPPTLSSFHFEFLLRTSFQVSIFRFLLRATFPVSIFRFLLRLSFPSFTFLLIFWRNIFKCFLKTKTSIFS
jgi:hypothetical protein